MPRTTPYRGWSYPDFEQNPYDTTIVGFYEAIDKLIFAAIQTADSSAITGITATNFDRAPSLPSGILNQVGALVRLRAGGRFTTDASPGGILTWFRVNTTDLSGFSLTLPASATDYPWWMQLEFIVRTAGASGLVQPNVGQMVIIGAGTSGPSSAASYSVGDLTGSPSVFARVQFDNSGNSILTAAYSIEIYHPVSTF